MSFERPTIQELKDRIKSDARAELGIKTILRRSIIMSFISAMAGVSHLILGYLEYFSKQLFPFYADDEFLLKWSQFYGVDRVQASFAELNITFTGIDGKVIPQGTLLQNDNGDEYVTTTEGTVISATSIVECVASLAGEAYNLQVGDAMSLVSPISGVESEGVVESVLIEGEDAQSDDLLRERLLDHVQAPPAGGNANDYIQWALEIPGVTRAWVFPNYYGANTVGVSFVEDDEVDIIPDAAKIQEVKDYIEELRPIGIESFQVFAPVPIVLDMEVNIDPETEAVKAACEQEIKDLILRDATVAGSWNGPGITNDGGIKLSKINEALSIGSGEDDHEIVTILGLAPANVTINSGEIIVPGTITWSAI